MRRGLLALALLSLACSTRERRAQEQLEAARAHYQDLARQGKPPAGPEFSQVRAELLAIPPDTAAGREAAKLRESLAHAAQGIPVRPLASLTPSNIEEPEVLEIERRCAALAVELGAAPTEAKPALQERIVACRADVETASRAHRLKELQSLRDAPQPR